MSGIQLNSYLILWPFNDNLKASSKSELLVLSLSSDNSFAYAVRNEVICVSYFLSIAK